MDKKTIIISFVVSCLVILLTGGTYMSNTMHFSDLNVLPVALQNRY